eukprot:scaffold79782_cov34-Attheya_sp.AAC.1
MHCVTKHSATRLGRQLKEAKKMQGLHAATVQRLERQLKEAEKMQGSHAATRQRLERQLKEEKKKFAEALRFQSEGRGGDDDNEDAKEKAQMRDTLRKCALTEKPNVKWGDIAGLENAKQILTDVRL